MTKEEEKQRIKNEAFNKLCDILEGKDTSWYDNCEMSTFHQQKDRKVCRIIWKLEQDLKAV